MYKFNINPKQFKRGNILKAIADLSEAEREIKYGESRLIQLTENLIKKKQIIIESKKYLLENIERTKADGSKIT